MYMKQQAKKAALGVRTCSAAVSSRIIKLEFMSKLDLHHNLPRACAASTLAASTVTTVTASCRSQEFQNAVSAMVAAAAKAEESGVSVALPGVSDVAAKQQVAMHPIRADLAALTSAVSGSSMAHTASSQKQQQQQHQQTCSAGGQTRPSLPTGTCVTQLLHVDPESLPPVSPPDAAVQLQMLNAPTAPNLSRGACPHLYYTLPEHLQDSISSSSLQEQPQLQAVQQQQQQQPQLGSCSSSSSSLQERLHLQAVQQLQQQPQLGGCSSSSSSSSAAGALQLAAALLRADAPVAIPTETVYGLAGNALSPAAVALIFAAKGRPADNPLIVHISDLDMLAQLYPEPHSTEQQQQQQQQQQWRDPLSYLPKQYHRLVAAFWPGPLTILLPASPLIPAAVTAGHPTMAVRMPAHPVARALIAAAGVPLAAPSANTSGRPSPTTAQHVMEDLAGKVAAVVDGGGCGFGVESTVLDALRVPPVVLRPGGVTAESLKACRDMEGLQVYSRDFIDAALEATPTTPGMKYRHYSPTAPVLLLDPTPAWKQQQAVQQQQQQQQAIQWQQGGEQSQQLQQLMAAATDKLLVDIQQGGLQEYAGTAAAAAAAVDAAHLQPLRVVLLSTFGCSSDGSSTSSNVQCRAAGWTPASLARIQDGHLQQQQQWQQQQQQQQQLLKGQESAVQCSSASQRGKPGSSSSGSNGGGCGGMEVLEYVLGSWQQPDGVAQQLFAGLRAADAAGAGLVVVQGLPPCGAGLAVMNRLHKAASHRVTI